MQQQHKKMFKVLAPIEKPGRDTYWMRVGAAFCNKDESINVYLDAVPVNQKEWKLQLREMDEEDFKKKDASPRQSAGGYPNGAVNPITPQRAPATDALPF